MPETAAGRRSPPLHRDVGRTACVPPCVATRQMGKLLAIRDEGMFPTGRMNPPPCFDVPRGVAVNRGHGSNGEHGCCKAVWGAVAASHTAHGGLRLIRG